MRLDNALSALSRRTCAAHSLTLIMIAAFANAPAMAQELMSLDCATASSLKSINGNTPTSINFTNQTSGTVSVYWIDYNGQEVLYNTLSRGGSYVQQTYLTHPWILKDQNNACLAVFEPVATQEIARVCDFPNGETTAFQGWSSTAGMWQQTLAPANLDFSDRHVREEDPGGGTDTCWDASSAIPIFDKISGGDWTVKADNKWGDDYVGWTPAAVKYYRKKGKAPCGSGFNQRMVMFCGTWTRPYITNSLVAAITATKVTSSRAGESQNRIWLDVFGDQP